jgi:hypothetical protein
MESLLKSKRLCQYMKTVIQIQQKIRKSSLLTRKKDEAIGVIMTYISWEICFHITRINYPHQVWKKIKSLFNKFDQSHTIQLEKELISLDPHSFDKIEDYLVCVKKM